MQGSDRGDAIERDGEGLRIAVVRARFNHDITQAMTDDCVAALLAMGVLEKHIRVCHVPGALEIPALLSALAQSSEFDAMVAIGCVIRGQTYHFEIVADQSAAGIMNVSVRHRVPVANCVLTVETEAQARERAVTHGGDAARVAVEMANVLDDWL